MTTEENALNGANITDNGTAATDEQDLQQRDATESLLTGQDGDEAVDSADVEAAMLQGWSRTNGEASKTTERDDKPEATGKKPDAEEPPAAKVEQQQTADLDPEVPGLGMKASQVKAQLARMDTLEKTLASANGHIGHLKQMIQSAGKGKTITKESLSKVREEFGDEYAEALAADLTAAGIGGGASVDDEALGRIVGERVAAERETMSQDMERRLVRARHTDAADYFQGGKHNAEFMQFVGTLPAERQQELATSWDSVVINGALDEFKAYRQKVDNEQTKQTRRLERSVAPTASRGASVTPPSVDPIEAGWNNVRGRGRGNAIGARR